MCVGSDAGGVELVILCNNIKKSYEDSCIVKCSSYWLMSVSVKQYVQCSVLSSKFYNLLL